MNLFTLVGSTFDFLGMAIFYVASFCGMLLIMAVCILVTAIALMQMWKLWCRYYRSYKREFAL